MTLQDCVVQRIYRLLIQMDWTMKQLSEQCGIPLAELESLMKQETADWTLEQLCTICRAFSISLPEFSMHPCFSGSFCRKHHNSCYFSPIKSAGQMHFLQRESFCSADSLYPC